MEALIIQVMFPMCKLLVLLLYIPNPIFGLLNESDKSSNHKMMGNEIQYYNFQASSSMCRLSSILFNSP